MEGSDLGLFLFALFFHNHLETSSFKELADLKAELLYHQENGRLVDAGGFSYLVNYICFSHIVLNLISFVNTKLLKFGQLGIKKPAQNEQAERMIDIFTDAISCDDRLSVPLPGTGLSLCQPHGVSRLCHPAMLL